MELEGKRREGKMMAGLCARPHCGCLFGRARLCAAHKAQSRVRFVRVSIGRPLATVFGLRFCLPLTGRRISCLFSLLARPCQLHCFGSTPAATLHWPMRPMALSVRCRRRCGGPAVVFFCPQRRQCCCVPLDDVARPNASSFEPPPKLGRSIWTERQSGRATRAK